MVSCTAESTSPTSVSTRAAGVARTASNGDLSAWKRSVADAPEAAAAGAASSLFSTVVIVLHFPFFRYRASCSTISEVRHVLVADQIRHGPAIQVVLGQAGFGQALHLRHAPTVLRREQQLRLHIFVVARIVALI